MTFFEFNTSSLKNEVYSTNLSSSSQTSSDDEGMVHDENLPPSKKAEFDPIKNLFPNITSFISAPLSTLDVAPRSSPETSETNSRDSTASDSDQEVFSEKRKRGGRKHSELKASDANLDGYYSDPETVADDLESKRVKRKINVAKKSNSSTHVSQVKINHICSCLLHYNIKTREDLIDRFPFVVREINQQPKIFKRQFTEEQCFEIFKQALKAYNHATDLSIVFTEEDMGSHGFKSSFASASALPDSDDLSRITRSYDRLVKSHEVKKSINEGILEILKSQEFVTVPRVVLGAGDTGVTLWLENYESHHNKTQEKLSQGEIPDVLIIAKNQGCFGHDYTLAQPHSFLERAELKWNPSDYVTTTNYEKNAFVNGRHVYQANEVILAKTQAPVLTASFTSIQKRTEHPQDWKCQDCKYRVIITTTHGEKTIYTHNVDICTGLGPASKIGYSIIPTAEFDRLSQFDDIKKFTPIVDGNQFMLTDSEENCTNPRSIVVYGGGGTASACYRKAFFNQDKGTQNLEFTEANRKNSVKWVARNYDSVGNGRLASRSTTAATSRGEQLNGELQKIIQDPMTGKLQLHFKAKDLSAIPNTFVLECDQFVCSIGQDDLVLKEATKEFKNSMQLNQDAYSGTPIGYKTGDGNIHAFGSASMGGGPDRSYVERTANWLKKENIGSDVGPGTMAPSRAQIKEYALKKHRNPVKSVNVNSASRRTMEKFLYNAGVRSYNGDAFLADVYEVRKTAGFDFNRTILQSLLDKHNLNGVFRVAGHGTLVRK